MVTGEGFAWTPPSPPACSPTGEPVMLDMEYKKTELTLKEVVLRVSTLQQTIDQHREAKRELLISREKQREEKAKAVKWREDVSETVLRTGSDLDTTINECQLQLHRLHEVRNRKILLHKQQREKLKREILTIEQAGRQLLQWEWDLMQAMASDARRMAARSQQVHDMTLRDLEERMRSLTEMGEKQYSRNAEQLHELEAEVTEQRAIFWENHKIRTYGQESALIAAVSSKADRDTQRAITHTKSGDVLIRFREKTGKREDVWMQLDVSATFITLQRLQTTKNSGSISSSITNLATRIDVLNDVTDVVFGAVAPPFYLQAASPASILPWMCFTIVLKNGELLCFSAHDEESALSWFLALQSVISNPFKIDGSARSHVTRSYLLWRRARMKVTWAARGSGLSYAAYLSRRIVSVHARQAETALQLQNAVFNDGPRKSQTQSHHRTSKKSSTGESFGVLALQIAVREKVITQKDLIQLTDDELRAKMIEGAEMNEPLRELFRSQMRHHKNSAGSSLPTAMSERTASFSSSDDVREVVEQVTPRDPVATTPRVTVLKDQTSTYNPNESIGVQVLRVALREKVLAIDDLTTLSDEQLQAKIILGVETHDALRELIRDHLRHTKRLPPQRASRGSASSASAAVGAVSATVRENLSDLSEGEDNDSEEEIIS
eukprot:c5790_g1_i1.p1 GENE.c5790_g1_i1~~c5790_g1_i1.p1  ORF type:complete len:666 (+),score=119.53 c5790_g1_i1:283-2280(+)